MTASSSIKSEDIDTYENIHHTCSYNNNFKILFIVHVENVHIIIIHTCSHLFHQCVVVEEESQVATHHTHEL